MGYWTRSQATDTPVERLQVLPDCSIGYDGKQYIAVQDTQWTSTPSGTIPGVDATPPRCNRHCGRAERWAKEPYVPPSVRNAPRSYWGKERPELVKHAERMAGLHMAPEEEGLNPTKHKRTRRGRRGLKLSKKFKSNPERAPTPGIAGIKSEPEL
ncbi:hypothetical protein FS749_008946 [Ceratobasidium sp. UAMH 11750]|nr:hypothetical protein FS749_008946 [Ceratobasidium sp. UAMH 11750]